MENKFHVMAGRNPVVHGYVSLRHIEKRNMIDRLMFGASADIDIINGREGEATFPDFSAARK